MATAFDVAYYLLHLDTQHDGEGLSNLKLQKLCYYAQGFHLAIFNTPLFHEEIEAWAHGPVVPEIYHRFKMYGSASIHPDAYPISLTAQECRLIAEVYDVFGQYSAWKLRSMTHEEPTWTHHEEYAGIIPKYEMLDYFKTRIN